MDDNTDRLGRFVYQWANAMRELDWMIWPQGQCSIASLLLVEHLRVVEPASWRVVVGVYDRPREGPPTNVGPARSAHCWISSGEVVVDPTVQQFGQGCWGPPMLVRYHEPEWGHYKPALTMSDGLEARARASVALERYPSDSGPMGGKLNGRSMVKDLFRSLDLFG